MPSALRQQDRARGALYGLAIGDALGMPTQMLSRDQIIDRWGPLLTGIRARPARAPHRRGLPAGAVTDDTEQAVLLGRLLSSYGRVDPAELADRPHRLGARRCALAGRSTCSARPPSARSTRCSPGHPAGRGRPLRRHQRRGHAHHPGRRRDASSGDLRPWSTACQQASLVTHNTAVALAGAAAVAAAVSAGDRRGAGPGGHRGWRAPPPRWACRARALGRRRGRRGPDPLGGRPGLRARTRSRSDRHRCYSLVGTSLATQESVPAAFAVLSAVPGRPVAGLPARGVARRRHRHDRRDGRARSAAPATALPPSRSGTRSTVIDASTASACRAGRPPACAARSANDPDRRVLARAARPGRRARLVSPARPWSTWCCASRRSPERGRRRAGRPSREIAAGGGFNVMAAAARQGLPVLLRGRCTAPARWATWSAPRWPPRASACSARPTRPATPASMSRWSTPTASGRS